MTPVDTTRAIQSTAPTATTTTTRTSATTSCAARAAVARPTPACARTKYPSAGTTGTRSTPASGSGSRPAGAASTATTPRPARPRRTRLAAPAAAAWPRPLPRPWPRASRRASERLTATGTRAGTTRVTQSGARILEPKPSGLHGLTPYCGHDDSGTTTASITPATAVRTAVICPGPIVLRPPALVSSSSALFSTCCPFLLSWIRRPSAAPQAAALDLSEAGGLWRVAAACLGVRACACVCVCALPLRRPPAQLRSAAVLMIEAPPTPRPAKLLLRTSRRWAAGG